MRTLVIIPTYNEAANIEPLVSSISSIERHEISTLIVDDTSPDGTEEIADRLAQRFTEKVFTMHRGKNMGLGSAYRDGFRFGLENGFDAVCEMDADGSHDSHQLLDQIAEAEKGTDVVIG